MENIYIYISISIFISIDSTSSSESIAISNVLGWKIRPELDSVQWTWPVYCSMQMPNETTTFYVFAEFSTVITIFTRSIGTQGAPHGANLENASDGLTQWQRASPMVTVKLFKQSWGLINTIKVLYFWLLNHLAVFQTFHSDISPGEICFSSAII